MLNDVPNRTHTRGTDAGDREQGEKISALCRVRDDGVENFSVGCLLSDFRYSMLADPVGVCDGVVPQVLELFVD